MHQNSPESLWKTLNRGKKSQIPFRLMSVLILLIGAFAWSHAQDQFESPGCIFTIGGGSTFSGIHRVEVDDGNAYAYNDIENEQFVIEIHGNNFIDIMIILEDLHEGKHEILMEMQVAIDISKDEGENYTGFSNYREEGAGYIQIEEIDRENERMTGSFSGIFHEDGVPEGVNVEINGTFNVKLE